MAESFESRVVRLMLSVRGIGNSEIGLSDVLLSSELGKSQVDPRPYAAAMARITDSLAGATHTGDVELTGKLEKEYTPAQMRPVQTVAVLYRRGLRAAEIASLTKIVNAGPDARLAELGLNAGEIALLKRVSAPGYHPSSDDTGAWVKIAERLGSLTDKLANDAVFAFRASEARLATLTGAQANDLTPDETEAKAKAQEIVNAKIQAQYIAAKDAEREKMAGIEKQMADLKAAKLAAIR